MIIFSIFSNFLCKTLNIKISLPLWVMLCVAVIWYGSIHIALRKAKRNELYSEAAQKHLNEVFFAKDKYITNIMYKYIERTTEDIENYEFTDKTKETLNVAISNIIK